ncbi:MAG: nicotinate (nicotinamide) nucleotide adenylyltransferase [Clostridia bacterium]
MKLGVFGGAFDPLHKEHIKIIEESRRILALDGVILLPTINPPHKEQASTSFEHRVEMLKVWAKGKDYIFIDETEKELNYKNSYTYRVLPHLVKKYKGAELIYIIGGDSMLRFHTWMRPERIAGTIKIAAAGREGYPNLLEAISAAQRRYGADITLLNITGSSVSSAELRACLELGLDTKDNVPEEILAYISQNNLYTKHCKLVAAVRTALSPKLFAHCARTVAFAMRYAGILNLPSDKVFYAALLHDIAKERQPILPQHSIFLPKIVHQYDGRTVAQIEYGIDDEDILDAIGFHTTAKPNMTNLGKLIYVADKLEEGRTYDGVERLRTITDTDFHTGFRLTLKHSYKTIKKKGGKIDRLTEEAHKYYSHNVV